MIIIKKRMNFPYYLNLFGMFVDLSYTSGIINLGVRVPFKNFVIMMVLYGEYVSFNVKTWISKA